MYVNDISVLFEPSESVYLFQEYMPSEHQNIDFTLEHENSATLLFLDIKICRKNGKFVTNVCRKPTFIAVFSSYESFISTYQKRGLLQTLFRMYIN